MRRAEAGPAGQHTVKGHNRALVLAEVAAASRGAVAVSRAQVAAATGLARATVSSLVDDLIAAGLLLELAPERGSRGRPGNPLTLDPDGALVLSVEVNVDYVAVALTDLTGTVRRRARVEADNRVAGPDAALRRAAALSAEIRLAGPGGALDGVVLALPALIDADGFVVRAPNLSGWDGTRPAEQLAGLLGQDVEVENESTLAALAQQWTFGAAGPRDFLYVSGEVGVGAGIVLDGRLLRGVRGFAGELGHVVVDPAGPPCHCGGRGCLEQAAGKDRMLAAAGLTDAGTEHLALRAAAGDARAVAAVQSAGQALGVALAGAVNLIDLPTIVLGGCYADLAGPLVPVVRAELTRCGIRPSDLELLVSDLGPDAALHGAARTVLRRVISE